MNISKREKFLKLINSPIKKREKKRFFKKDKASIGLMGDSTVFLDHPYDIKLVKKYHFLGNFKFDKNTKYWEVTKLKDIEVCRFLLNLNEEFPEYEWSVDEKALALLEFNIKEFERESAEHLNLIRLKKMPTVDVDFSHLKIPLLDYQKVGLKFLEETNGLAIIGDEMGLGKTLQAISYVSKHKLRTIVVCPASLKYNWSREVVKFTHCTFDVLTERNPDLLDHKKHIFADFTIINYDQLDKYESFLSKAKFDAVIIDEAHYINNTKAGRSKLVKKFFKKHKHRILLSGTVIKNKPIDFYNLLNFVRPDLFANKEKFGLRYCDAKPNFYGRGFTYNGSSNLRELHVKISPFYLRRLKKHVLKELPPKTINMMNYDLNTEESKFYNHILNSGKKDIDPSKPKTFSYLQLTTKLKQFLSLQKVKYAKEFVDQIIEETNSKVIIFAQFIETQNKLVEVFGTDIACSILGKDKPEDRMNVLDEFSSNPQKRVLVASTKAAGVGLNITAADKVIFLDLLWSPSDLEQAEDRSHRMGQTLPVDIYYLIYNNTVENILWSILDKKRDIQAQIMDGRNNKNLASEDDVIKEFLEKFSLVVNQRKDTQ